MKKSVNSIGYVTAMLVVTSIVFKINHLPGTGIGLIIAGALISIYLPVFIINKSAENNGGQVLPMHYVSGISAALINMAIVFKIQRWPGAGPLLILGLASFALIYLPMLFVNRSKQEGANKLMLAAGTAGLACFALGVLFKAQHWPGGIYLLLASVPLLFFIYFPMYMKNTNISEEKKYVFLRSAFFTIIIGALLTIFILTSTIFNPDPQSATVASQATTVEPEPAK